MPQAIVSNFAIWLTSTNSSKKGDPVKLLTWVENKRGIVWDENGEKEEKESVTVMKRKWEREKERERVTQNEDDWLVLAQPNSIGTTNRL